VGTGLESDILQTTYCTDTFYNSETEKMMDNASIKGSEMEDKVFIRTYPETST
jgi:purine-nucleoside phosphorylase